MNPSEIKRVAILRFSALGDVAMTIPAVYSVAEAYPDIEFKYFTRKKFSELFVDPPSNLKVEGVDVDAIKGCKNLKIYRLIASYSPDAVADLHNVGRTWVIDTLFRLRGKKVRMVNKGRRERSLVLSHQAASTPFFTRYKDVFDELGLFFPYTFVSLFPDGVKSPIPLMKPVVGVAPFARYENKTYPLEKMKKLTATLASHGVMVLLFGGGEKEKRILEEWADDIPGCTSLAGRFNLQEELAVMANLDAMISMDSANQHLASLVNTRVFTIWGSTTPECGFAPWGQIEDDSFCANVNCQPCSIAGSELCRRGDLKCFEALDPVDLAERIVKLLQ